jgi:hypothetical protein
MRRIAILACAYAVLGWAFFTGLLIALGNVLLPSISRPATPFVVLALGAVTAAAVAAISLDYFRRSKRDDVCAAALLGTCVASIGLALDAVLLLATDFRYPNVDEEKTATLAVLLLLGYAVAAVTPVLMVSLRAARDTRGQ